MRQSGVFIICLVFLVSCGNKVNKTAPKLNEIKSEEIRSEKVEEREKLPTLSEENRDILPQDLGMFVSKLTPVNNVFQSVVRGDFYFNFDNSLLKVQGRVSGAAPFVRHFQIMHLGGQCPRISDDINQDGWIDYWEGKNVYGNRLIHLDGNLETQIEGIHYGPISNDEGSYSYQKTVDRGLFMEDLYTLDNDLFDDLIKLKFGEKIDLTQRVLIIYGISSQLTLPNSVNEGLENPAEYVPIACGKIERLN